ncbi:uncharacterized protein [Penaeus vannamei]|uniref:uncharacterized protein n=1 Tax=Penaeus vannamei TaxID=6689 RepID=UPI00387F9742
MSKKVAVQLITLFLLLYTRGVAGEDVTVFSLQPDIWEAPRDDVFLRFNMSLQQVAASVSEFSVCSRVFPTALTTLQVLFSYATADSFSNALMMYIKDGRHSFRYNNVPQRILEDVKVPTVLRRWRHYCHVVSGDRYAAFIDGAEVASGPVQVDNRVLPLNGTLVVGQEQDGLSKKMDKRQILKGFVAQVNLWSYGLPGHVVASIANCERNDRGDVFSSDRLASGLELINVDSMKKPVQDLCNRNETFIIFPEKRTFMESVKICDLFRTKIYAPADTEINRELNATMWREGFCAGTINMWIGVSDEMEEGVWRRFSDSRVITDINFAGGQPDNTREENCMAMAGGEGVWADYGCREKNIACVPCAERTSIPLYMRGICTEMRTETMFEVLGYTASRPFFHGFHGYMLTSERNDWHLLDTVANRSLARLTLPSRNVYPIGKHQWTLASPICDQPVGSELVISLSTCETGEYMCDSGQCIDVDARCDAKDDCDDQTDEDDCSVLDVPENYRNFKPPKSVENPVTALPLDLQFSFLRILRIEDVQQAIHLEFTLAISWFESRLRYLNLREDIHANKLSPAEKESIWRPRLEFPNVQDGELKLLRDDVFVKKLNNSLPFDFNAVGMDNVYSGDSALLVQVQHYSGSFVCRFNVYYYPFDAQHCSVSLQVSSVSKDLVSLSEESTSVLFSEDSTLPTYTIGNFSSESSNYFGRESGMKIKYTLTRRYTLIVLSVYMPSSMLLLVGYSTLYVKVELLQVRLVVSLTTLLVLYTFFNQASSSLPQTAYIKMIDVWFFSCTILLFVIIIVHVIVEGLESEVVFRVGPKTSGDVGRRSRVMVSAEGLLRLCRLVVVPVAAGIFMVVYWSLILS